MTHAKRIQMAWSPPSTRALPRKDWGRLRPPYKSRGSRGKLLSSGPCIAYSFLRYLLSTYCVPYSRGRDKIVNKVDKFPVLMELSFAFPSSFFFLSQNLTCRKTSFQLSSYLSSPVQKTRHGRTSKYPPNAGSINPISLELLINNQPARLHQSLLLLPLGDSHLPVSDLNWADDPYPLPWPTSPLGEAVSFQGLLLIYSWVSCL